MGPVLRAFSKVVLIGGAIHSSSMNAQACQLGSEYQTEFHGVLAGTTRVWYHGDSLHATYFEPNEPLRGIIDVKLATSGLVHVLNIQSWWDTLKPRDVHLVMTLEENGFATTIVENSQRGVREVTHDSLLAGYFPFGDPAALFLEILVQRVRKLGGPEITIPWIIFQSRSRLDMQVRRLANDSLLFDSPKGSFRVATDRDGSFLGAVTPDGKKIRRVRCLGL